MTESTTTSAGAPTPAPQSSKPAVVSRLEGLTQFKSPTGNIGCVIDRNGARCDIKAKDWTPPPKPAACPVDYGQGLEVQGNHKGSVVCAGDTVLYPTGDSLDLAYDHAVEVETVRCTSRSDGMHCDNRATGHGFFLSRQSYRVF